MKLPRAAGSGNHGAVVVLRGGSSLERSISLESGAMVLESLERLGIPAVDFDPARRTPTEFPAEFLRPDARVFIALHGGAGEDGTVQGTLEMLGVPYTGSGVLASALSMDKTRLKQIWQARGLPTPEFFEWRAGESAPDAAAARLGYPLMVKPVCEGSSLGAVRVDAAGELCTALEQAVGYGGRVLVERWIEGEEYTVGVLGARALPTIRLETPGGFYDYHAKYESSTTRYLCPCGLDTAGEAELARMVLQAFEAPGAAGWGRVDLMRERGGAFHLLEINTVPGLGPHSLVPKAAHAAGMEFDDLVLTILESAAPRGAGQNA